MPKYEVELTATATAYVEVAAADEDEAHDKAKEEASVVMDSDWEIETRYASVDNITKIEDDA